jgi:N-acyl-D-amino-acid deacylase
MLGLLEDARRGGIDAVADQYPYTAYSTSLSFLLPSWSLAAGAPPDRARVRAETMATIRAKGYEDLSWVRVVQADGRTVAEISGSSDLGSQVDTLLDLVRNGGGSGVYAAMSEDDVESILRSPLVAVASDGSAVTFGEGKPHPRSYGTNARVLARYVHGRGTLSLEEAVRKMTALPARTFGLRDRGLLLPGSAADAVLFRADAVRDEATFDDPHRYSTGFDIVIVNGQVAVEAGEQTPARAGRTLLRQ